MLMYNCEVDLLKERNLMRPYSREELLAKLAEITEMIGKVPTQRDLREFGMSEDPFYRVFGNYSNAKQEFITGGTGIDGSPKEVKISGTVDKLLEQLKTNLSEEEIKAVVQATGVSSKKPKLKHTSHETGYFKMLVMSDTHIGHSKFREDWWDHMLERAVREKVDFAYHGGDILEGMSNRPGHIYELEYIGFEAQFTKAKRLIGECPFEVRAITGNHDSWYTGKADQGINIGHRLEEALNNFVYLGDSEADQVVENVRIKLFHGNDGGSYAISYRGQKIVESLDGGDKPHILITGHDHKSVFFQTRNVHVIGAGTLCEQTSFMRGKKLAAHRGYWLVDVWSNEEGLVRIRPEWNPFY